MVYVIISEDKMNRTTFIRKTVQKECEGQDITPNVDMVKRLNKKARVRVFKEVKLENLGGKWK